MANTELLCHCGIKAELINNSYFECSDSDSKEIIYVAELHGTNETASPDMLEHLSAWVSTGSSLTVQGSSLSIDPNCYAEVDSLGGTLQCVDSTTAMPTNASTPGSTTEVTTDSPSEAISSVVVGLVIGILLMSFLVALIIVIFVVVALRLKKHSKTMSL